MPKKNILLGLLVGLAGAALLFAWPSRLTLTIRERATDRVIFRAPVVEGEEFILSFIHSVNKRPVYDTLRIAADHLVIVQSRFDSVSVGMPETYVIKDGWMIHQLNRSMPEIGLFVGRVANHTLELRGRQTALADLTPPGRLVVIRPEKISLYQTWVNGGFK